MDLRTIRVLKKMSQWDLTKVSGVAQSRISLDERGVIRLSEAERKALEKALGVPGGIDWGQE
jgi:transcriptional regulator with XRE-family HTH domain